MKEKKKNSGFKTPEGYFDSLKDRIRDKLGKEDTAFPETEGFKVPDGYFDSLNERIRVRMEASETKVVRLNPYRKYFYAAAAVAALLILVFGVQWNTGPDVNFDTLASAEIAEYLSDQGEDLSSYDIAEVIPVDELGVNDILDEKLEEENIMDYLDEAIDDLDELNIDYYEEE